MPAPVVKLAESIDALEPSAISCQHSSAKALTIVRDGVITGDDIKQLAAFVPTVAGKAVL